MHQHPHQHSHHTLPTDGKDESIAMLKYMIAHNSSHAGELKTLAEQLASNGNATASDIVTAATEKFDEGNALLAHALEEVED